MFSNTENDMQYTRFVDVIIKNRDTKYNIVKKLIMMIMLIIVLRLKRLSRFLK